MVSLVGVNAPKTILIVDDTPNNLQLLFKYLSNGGYKILIAQSGKKAIETAAAYNPDLILLDVIMPEFDGFATCRHLKAQDQTKDIPIIFMTALAETENKVQGFDLGAVDYITKPINREELLARIKTHLALQSLNQRLTKDARQQKLLLQISDRIHQCSDLKLLLVTASEDIRTFLDCNCVWLTHLTNKNISLAAYASATDIDLEQSKTWSDLSLELQEDIYEQQAEVRMINSQDHYTANENRPDSNPSLRIVAPILINSNQPQECLTKNQSEQLPKSEVNFNTLWGWLIIDYIQSSSLPVAEIELLKALTTQLAIGIKQAQLYQQLSQQALIDPLTKVYNRRYCDSQLDLEWRRLKRTSSSLSLIMCDVDCFKLYNDTYGHQQGDQCLQQIAQAISTTIKRPADVLARYGGEEFIVILPQTPQAGAVKVAESMRMAVKKLNMTHLNSTVDSVVTISVGVAHTVPNAEDSPSLLVEATDLALYKAKERGRNCIAVYPDPISHAKNRQDLEISWVKRLRQALQNNLFSLYAQPISPLDTNDHKKYFEVLLRLTDHEQQVITPNFFLDIAERNSLMPDIDTWVINNLFSELASCDHLCWQDHRFSINLSGASLNNEAFLEFLLQKLADYHLPPELFCFEITETVAVSDLDKISNFIKSLKNIGCSFALDDFGKGMSSLTYLNNLAVDYLKIDGSFISNLNNNQAAKVMVEAINHIAAGIGLKTVAEFVENQTILDTIRDLKVDFAQGFYLGRPEALMKVIS